MKKAFLLYDVDGKGKITVCLLLTLAACPGLRRRQAPHLTFPRASKVTDMQRVAKELGENLSKEELQGILDESDRDGSGTITEDEFLRVMRNQELI